MSLTIETVVAELAPLYPQTAPLTNPVQMLVWDNIGYLIDDDRRATLFAEFAGRIGFDAKAIAHAPPDTLIEIAGRGGRQPLLQAERLRAIGEIILTHAKGDLGQALKTLSPSKARSLLKKFPATGDPGADRILLFAGIASLPAIESNGLRTLIRLGLVIEGKSYGQSYTAAITRLNSETDDATWLKDAWLILREHGRSLCKRSAPLCQACPLDARCAHIVPTT